MLFKWTEIWTISYSLTRRQNAHGVIRGLSRFGEFRQSRASVQTEAHFFCDAAERQKPFQTYSIMSNFQQVINRYREQSHSEADKGNRFERLMQAMLRTLPPYCNELQEAPVTVTLNDNHFEIWGSLGFSLPTSNEQVNAQPGDMVLYSGQYICIFYGSNSYSYTRLGKIDGLTESELRMFLKAGESNISVTLSVSDPTGISRVQADGISSKAYTLQGTVAQTGHKGIVIQNGKKIIK